MNRTTKLIIAALIISNLVLIGFFLMKKKRKKHQPRKSPREMVIEKLDFNAEQTVAYDSLISHHKKATKQLRKDLMQAKSNVFASLDGKANQDSLLNIVAGIQAKMERTHLNHFGEIKKLCNEDQQDKLYELSKRFAHLFAPKRGPKPRGKEKGKRKKKGKR